MAGSGATRATVYNKAGASVRRMEAARWPAALFLLIVMFAGIYLFGGNSRTIATLGLPAVIIAACCFFYWVKTMGDRAGERSRRALDARRGAAAEEAVGSRLGELPEGFYAVDDFASRKGNIDHIVISTRGILTVGTKSHRGVVRREGEALTHDGKPFEMDFIKQAWAEAYSIRDFLTDNGVCNLRPQPVIVFTDADVQVEKKVGGVHVVGGKDLNAFLEGMPAWMSDRLAKRIIDCLLSK